MDMASVLERLKRLQGVLVEKYDVESRITDSPEQISLQKTALDDDKKAFIAKDAECKEEREKVMKLHEELETAMRVRESGEKGMDDITTHREYEALDKQISEATLREQDLRRELQVEEKVLADLTDSMKAYEQSIREQEEELQEMQATFDQEMDGYKAKLGELEAQEKVESEGIDSEVLFKFHRIIQRNSDGIVSVRGGVCTGCRMILPMQFANEVRRGEGIMFCPYCSRILFYEEVSDDEELVYDTGSLVGLEDDDADDSADSDADDENSTDDITALDKEENGESDEIDDSEGDEEEGDDDNEDEDEDEKEDGDEN